MIPDGRPLSQRLDSQARIERAWIVGRRKLVAKGYKGVSEQDFVNAEARAVLYAEAAAILREAGH